MLQLKGGKLYGLGYRCPICNWTTGDDRAWVCKTCPKSYLREVLIKEGDYDDNNNSSTN